MNSKSRSGPIPEPLLRAAFGAQAAQLLCIAVRLGLAEKMQRGAPSAAELAGSLNVDAMALERVLRALVITGVCNEQGNACFGMTALGEYLRADHPQSVAARVLLNVEVHERLWSDLFTTVRTGEPASERVFGVPFYDHLAQDPAAAQLFDRAMAGGGWIENRLRPALEAYDFGQFRTIVDVGGGNGTLMAELLKTNPSVRGTVFDLPRLETAALATIGSAALSERCDFVAGNALESVPAGHDAYVLSNFLNSFSDDAALSILRNCRRAMSPAGKVLLLEWVSASGDEDRDTYRAWDTATMDIVMLAAFGSRGGRLRTKAEFSALLDRAALSVSAFVATHASIWVIETVPTQPDQLS